MPGWVLAGRSHIIYSKAGVGKTIFSIQLLRALVGDPSMPTFLDSGLLQNSHLWKRSRVLYIGSDMGDSAEEMTNTYIHKLGLAGRDFLQQVHWWFQNTEKDTPKWTANINHLVRLINRIREQRQSGSPFTAVVIDSMKSICPDGLRVGDQAFNDYLQLISDICSREGVALIWIHHSAKDGNGMQGIQAISENASAVYKLSREADSCPVITLTVEKQRAGGRSRELSIDLFNQGSPRLLSGGLDDDGFSEPVLNKVDHFKADIIQLLEEDNDLDRSWATIQHHLGELVSAGAVEKQGGSKNTNYRIALDGRGKQITFNAFTDPDAFTAS